LKFIQCPYMEKRLKGINEIKDFIERISLSSRATTIQNVHYMRPIIYLKPTKWLNRARLVDWLREKNLCEMLLKEHCHVEVIKRLPEIMKFLAESNELETSLLDLVWESAREAHDSEVRAIYALIIDIS
jgi:hypothetical protein